MICLLPKIDSGIVDSVKLAAAEQKTQKSKMLSQFLGN